MPGNYVLCERLTAGWRNTRPNSTNPTYDNQPCVTLVVSPGLAYTVLFGNRQSVAASEAPSSPPPDSVFTSILPDTDEEGEESTPLLPFELPVEEAEDGAQKMYLPVVMN